MAAYMFKLGGPLEKSFVSLEAGSARVSVGSREGSSCVSSLFADSTRGQAE